MTKYIHPLSWPLRLIFLLPTPVIFIFLMADFFDSQYMPLWEIALIFLVFLTPCILAFYGASTITVRKSKNEVVLGFRPIFWKRIPFSGVQEVALAEVDPMKFGGWGIKGNMAKEGLLFSAGGNRALLFKMMDGGKIYVSVGDDSKDLEDLLKELSSIDKLVTE